MKNIKSLIIIIVALLFLSNCNNNKNTKNNLNINKFHKEEKILETQKNIDIVRQLYEDCLNKRNFQLLNDIFAPDYKGVRGETGPSGFAETTQSIILAFPDIQWKIEDLFASEDKVVIRWSTKGTHLGTFRGIFSATNKVIEDNAIVIYQFKDNKILNVWMQVDRLGFLQQLGIIPEDLSKLSSLKIVE